jgi:hypothetical protein
MEPRVGDDLIAVNINGRAEAVSISNDGTVVTIHDTQPLPVSEWGRTDLPNPLPSPRIYGLSPSSVIIDEFATLQTELNETATIEKAKIEQEERIIRELEGVMEKRFRETLKTAERDLQYAEDNIRSYRTELNKLFQKQELSRATIFGMDDRKGKAKEKFVQEMREITDVRGITGYHIAPNNGHLVLETDFLYIETTELEKEYRKYIIGHFDIDIDFIQGQVLMFNKNKENHRQSCWTSKDNHPHVRETGQACWGNVSTTISILMNDFEIKALAGMVVNYLESFNKDDAAGRKIVNWDFLNKKGETRYCEKVCEKCGNLHPIVSFVTCTQCGQTMCPDCIGEFEHHGTRMCTDCARHKFHKCDFCGQHHLMDNLFTSPQGRYICEICNTTERLVDNAIPRYVVPAPTVVERTETETMAEPICHVCGVTTNGIREMDDGLHVCPECFNNNYVECYNCDVSIPRTNAIERNGTMLCQTCANARPYRTCGDCECEITGDGVVAFDDNNRPYTICQECYEAHDYHTCPDCNRILHADDRVWWSEDEWVCRDCYNNNTDYQDADNEYDDQENDDEDDDQEEDPWDTENN